MLRDAKFTTLRRHRAAVVASSRLGHPMHRQQLSAHRLARSRRRQDRQSHLRDRWGLVLEALGKPSSMVPFIMPERIAKTPTNEAVKDPTGSGPFMMKRDEWSPGSKVVYVKAPTYVPRQDPPSGLAGGKVAKVDRVGGCHP